MAYGISFSDLTITPQLCIDGLAALEMHINISNARIATLQAEVVSEHPNHSPFTSMLHNITDAKKKHLIEQSCLSVPGIMLFFFDLD
ncbi:hypothetical protein SCP_1402740 [Sparassis crispa]|uniref:Uncharacterized protein n=1 Tax=Sparassis crispa TaxID=139825 RepID=A0A401H348_9APHY|nr:hypothetical protein SCP_1402740 [Sparassis crispa]GBE88866.1 hypothetical protein SCP_1402740 [Sparassis crispa]